MSSLLQFTDASFQHDVLDSDTPVLVDFTAAWCAPCQRLKLEIEKLSVEWNGRVKVGQIDTDQNVQTTVRYGVMGIPAMILFVKGQPVERLQGFMPKEKIAAKLKPHL